MNKVFCCFDYTTKLGHRQRFPFINRMNQIFLRAAIIVLLSLEEMSSSIICMFIIFLFM